MRYGARVRQQLLEARVLLEVAIDWIDRDCPALATGEIEKARKEIRAAKSLLAPAVRRNARLFGAVSGDPNAATKP